MFSLEFLYIKNQINLKYNLSHLNGCFFPLYCYAELIIELMQITKGIEDC